MTFDWLKQYVPRGLYGRAALILILPVVTLQLVVSVVFIQRHFEGVTAQMTRSLSHELRLVLKEIDTAPSQNAAQEEVKDKLAELEISVRFTEQVEVASERRWYDFSGTVVMRELFAELPQATAIRLPNDDDTLVYVGTRFGPAELSFDRRRVSATNPHQLLVNMVFFGGLMTLIAFVYLRNQLRPITRLAAAAQAFGRGNTVPYSPAGALEVRAAGNAFLDMRARIERQIEQRTLMLSGVSHDLRTPLTRMRLGLSFLDDADRVPLERDVDDMQRMLDEFLSFARGASEVTPEELDFCPFFHEIAKGFTTPNRAVKVTACEITQPLMLKKMVMKRAIENLVNNALRYGSTVEMSAIQMKKSVIIRVEDDGPGIPEAQREDALKPFNRLDAARNQDQGSGVGLGLSIAADAARAHGGVLRLETSETLGGLQADIVIAI
ncbi:ATP-binding protein [Cognatishimia activa]|uniref:histidine kinase n=1 Tax=Cognatishimia activa TaxID=1715691 RepID=A0A0P1JCS4_9RHOB|nr:ATP-binding protein [Cognatishimia activa]CUJ29435.1 Osmolarity sensor protein EnvZ [Cognatishimia activa]CUK27236.1 Osmolarity sensor protein EnvZ [Cognatishimia activa]